MEDNIAENVIDYVVLAQDNLEKKNISKQPRYILVRFWRRMWLLSALSWITLMQTCKGKEQVGKREIQNIQFEEKRNTGNAMLELCPVLEEIKC